jgi:hypothetical protein
MKLERVTRFELATYALARRRSTAELNPQTEKTNTIGDPMGIRTPVCAVRGRRPRPLDDGASLVDREGLEPSTVRLRVGCSTIELAVQTWRRERDLNPRGTCAPYSFSKAAPSAAWVSLQEPWWS